MKYAADFRELARDALRGKWGIAVIVGLVAVLLGGAGNEGPEINLNIEGGNANLGFEIAGTEQSTIQSPQDNRSVWTEN